MKVVNRKVITTPTYPYYATQFHELKSAENDSIFLNGLVRGIKLIFLQFDTQQAYTKENWENCV